jgi:Tol biopolymer transport system component/DNA-binding winged helix-turn-helix (wHTH) protein
MHAPKHKLTQFGDFEVDQTANELRRNGRRVKIQDLPFRLLVALLESPGEVMSREELGTALWNDTVVDFDAGLHTAVRKLREALGDSASAPKFVETVPRHGYRFLAPVAVLERPGAVNRSLTLGKSSPRGGGKFAYVAGAVLAFTLLFGLTRGWLETAPIDGNVPQLVPLVSERGILRSPSLSPDGTRVAFSWAMEDEDSLNLYVQRIDGSGRERLTAGQPSDRYPTWSPDGAQIAFLRNSEVVLVPAAGGLERRLTTSADSGMAWGPGCETLAVSDRESPSGPVAIFLVDVATGERRNVSLPESSTLEDRWPAFSPDGKKVAFARNATTVTELYVVPVEGGTPERVLGPLETGRNLTGLAWSPDGDHLIFALGRLGLFATHASERDAVSYVRLDIAGTDVSQLSVIKDPITGQMNLAYGHERSNWDIWGSSLDEGGIEPIAIQASTRSDSSPAVSPDGHRLAFSSQRSGTPEIWWSDADGSRPFRLTHFEEGSAGTPQWSQDGRKIAFDATLNGNRDIYIVGDDGTELRRLTEHSSSDGQPSWSHDGDWIYFMSDRSGSRQIWKAPSAGGAAVQLTRDGGYQAFESPDGTTVYYAKRQQDRGVWSVPAHGGREQPVVDGARQNLWAVAADGIYFFDVDDAAPALFDFTRSYPVKKFTFEDGRISTVAVIKTDLPSNLPSFGLSQDGRWLSWVSRRDPSSELLLIRNVRFDWPAQIAGR